MELIFIYGLPGSGKLTIAKKLSNILGEEFKIFHNQMTVDLVSQFFPFSSEKWNYLNSEYRRLMFQACAEEGINLITTFVYANDYDGDPKYVKNLIELVEKSGGQIHFIHLVCDKEIVFQRIQNTDRKKHKKVTKPESLQDTMNKWDILSPINFVDNYTIDTGKLTAEESARNIVEHCNLGK